MNESNKNAPRKEDKPNVIEDEQSNGDDPEPVYIVSSFCCFHISNIKWGKLFQDLCNFGTGGFHIGIIQLEAKGSQVLAELVVDEFYVLKGG